MKQVFAYLNWIWSKWDFTQKIWMLGCFFFGSGIVDWWKNNEAPWQIYAAFTTWSIVFIKWFIWDGIANSWNQFKKERNDLFTVIKESDNASKSN